jgi:hypothetical protein
VARPHFSLTDRGSRWLMVMGRLKPGVTVPQAQANIAAIASHLAREYPQTNEQLGVAVYKPNLVEPMGFEPTTSSMPSRRAPNCATAPPRR